MLGQNPDSTISSAGKLTNLIRVASKTRWFNEDQLGALNAYLTMIGEVPWDKHAANEYLEIIKDLPVMLRNSTQRRVREDEELVSLSERAVAHLASMSTQPQSLAAARAQAMAEALADADPEEDRREADMLDNPLNHPEYNQHAREDTREQGLTIARDWLQVQNSDNHGG